MSEIILLAPGERACLKELFSKNQRDTVLIDSVLEGQVGCAMADSQKKPQAARLDLGPFAMFGGDPEHPAAESLLKCMPLSLITPESQTLRNLVFKIYHRKASAITFTEFLPKSLRRNKLHNLANNLPDGYEVQRIDRVLAAKASEELQIPFDGFSSLDDFAQRGIGFVVLHSESGSVVCSCISMAKSSTAIDIEVVTAKEHRRRGLAKVCSARLLLACLEQNLEPKWLAANQISKKLAFSLGYQLGETYETLLIEQKAE